jgi:hypothetical protein
MKRHEWPPIWISHLRRRVLHENTKLFAAHWVYEDGSEVSPRTCESWEQGVRRPPLYIRQHMTNVLYRLRHRQGKYIRMPTEND